MSAAGIEDAITLLSEGTKHLREYVAVDARALDLGVNNIGDGGANALADALVKNSSLQILDLGDNKIGPGGAKVLADALTMNSLSGYKIGDAGAEALAIALESNDILKKLGILTRIGTQVKLVNDELNALSAAAQEALEADEKVRWGRAKLMVVGKGAAGKTSTIRTLLGQPYNPDHDSTIGVDLKLMRTRDWEERKHVGGADLGEQFAKYKYRQQDVAKDPSRHSSNDVVSPPQSLGNKSTSTSASMASFGDKEIAKAVSTPLRLHIKQQADKPDEEISFTIWDYGGQEVFYALHHLFLTQYGIYMLVFDMREVLGKERFREKLDEKEYAKLALQEDSLETLRFWIDSIRLHAPDASIILVGTHLDQVAGSEEHEEIEDTLETKVLDRRGVESLEIRNYKAHLCFFPIDNTHRDFKDNCILSLRESLLKAAADKDFVQKKVPLRWSYCLEKLLLQDKDYLSLNAVEELAITNCHVSKEDVSKMLEYMHELGVLVHLTTGQHDVLRQIVVIRPQWLLENLSRRGVASRELLEWLWQWEPVDYLVELMHAMLLACPSPWIDDIDEEGDFVDEEGALLIPSLLQPVKDSVREEALKGLKGPRALAFVSFKILPKGVFQRFITSLIQSLPDLVGVRNGVVFSNFASLAFDNVDVILETSGRRIMLHFETLANKSLKNHVKIIQHCLRSIDSCFMRGNLGPKLFLSSDGSDCKKACASVDALADATKKEVSSLQRGKRLPLERFSPFVEDGEAARGLHASVTSDAKPFDVFLSHAWGENRGVHEKVKAVAGALESRGIRCWLDEKDIGMEVLDSMADGIDRCKAVVVFVTREYMRKVNKGRMELDNCRDEFCYALQRVKPASMIPCVLEKEMEDMGTWEGRFGISWSGNPLYVRMLNGGKLDEVEALVWKTLRTLSMDSDNDEEKTRWVNNYADAKARDVDLSTCKPE
ncbi:Leucine-rich repeat serine/threonine-protein kinase 2 [Hondaea fermentalgiana]|uniref:Leucine-rich repeat serine/threonine-protein kinase 2 n=1 Tax=Hondaea fermentalgiana TaxID=2315210 RepID=A0A2R5G8P0_9STRA|nr:Leucine-rich repeat serine/threonine-protein kinase 2 [Hondaea fermentalgiana]|eukprot:GBG24034.1 Leucine-rich repeat serine/threonine-protein kinase 2 [Hondaea fermentalgiana]